MKQEVGAFQEMVCRGGGGQSLILILNLNLSKTKVCQSHAINYTFDNRAV